MDKWKIKWMDLYKNKKLINIHLNKKYLKTS